MKTQLKKPDPVVRTIQSKPRAANQAPIETILQRYGRQPVQAAGLEDEPLLQGKFKAVQREAFEEDELLQGKFETAQREKMDEEELLQGKFDPVQREAVEDEKLSQTKPKPEQRQTENRTGLPDNLKIGIENLSGYSMDDVRVHYNSAKPAQLQALAYTQGTDIHVAPGQEKHLPHEAWHVVQQKQGRVQPTMQLQGVNINDNQGLEKEADVMGNKITSNNIIVQRMAYTATRPLGQAPRPGRQAWWRKDMRMGGYNRECNHRHIIFNPQPTFQLPPHQGNHQDNIGFHCTAGLFRGPGGLFSENHAQYGYRVKDILTNNPLQDNILVRAIGRTPVPNYDLLDYNCQDWTDDVIRNYNQLTQQRVRTRGFRG